MGFGHMYVYTCMHMCIYARLYVSMNVMYYESMNECLENICSNLLKSTLVWQNIINFNAKRFLQQNQNYVRRKTWNVGLLRL
jgi:hypothetical protein